MRLLLEKTVDRKPLLNTNDPDILGKIFNLKGLSEIFGINYRTLKSRLNQGFTLEQALSTPIKNNGRDNSGNKNDNLQGKEGE